MLILMSKFDLLNINLSRTLNLAKKFISSDARDCGIGSFSEKSFEIGVFIAKKKLQKLGVTKLYYHCVSKYIYYLLFIRNNIRCVDPTLGLLTL